MHIPEELPDIRLYFSGVLDFCVNQDRTHFQVGILDYAPKHLLTFDIKEIINGVKIPKPCGPDLSISLPKRLWLQCGASQGDVQLYEPGDFHRDETQDDRRDLRWVIDIEGEDGYNSSDPIGTNPDGFRSILTINSGLFFTARLSEDRVRFRDPQAKLRGKVALLVGGNINLREPDAEAILTDGRNILCRFPKRDNTKYEITIRLEPPEPHEPNGDHENDFNFHYKAIATKKKNKLELIIDSKTKNSPDARCTSPILRVTQDLTKA